MIYDAGVPTGDQDRDTFDGSAILFTALRRLIPSGHFIFKVALSAYIVLCPHSNMTVRSTL
jgi:hypothetical protein